MRSNLHIPNDAVRPPTVADSNPTMQPAVEVWDSPFDRWMRMADDMLRDWPRPVTQRPVTPLRAARKSVLSNHHP